MNIIDEKMSSYNSGLKEAQWQVTKAMLALETQFEYNEPFSAEQVKNLLKFIHDEMEKKLV